MVLEFTCPACGADLSQALAGEEYIACPYCQSRVLVPPDLRTPQPAFPLPVPAATPQPQPPGFEPLPQQPAQASLQGKGWLWIILLVVLLPTCLAASVSLCAALIGVLVPFLGPLFSWLGGG